MDDDKPKPKPGIMIGEDLALHSVAELEARIDTLKAEIVRIEAAVSSKRSSRQAAASAFKI